MKNELFIDWDYYNFFGSEEQKIQNEKDIEIDFDWDYYNFFVWPENEYDYYENDDFEEYYENLKYEEYERILKIRNILMKKKPLIDILYDILFDIELRKVNILCI